MKIQRLEEEVSKDNQSYKNYNTSFILTDRNTVTRYDFEILNHHEAIVYSDELECPKKVIEEFLFYSGFISQIRNEKQEIIYHQQPKHIMKLEIDKIQPSQLYINEEKLRRLLTWVKEPKDIIVPVIYDGNQYVLIDGHTRLKVAELLGFERVYAYMDEWEESIEDFVHFCHEEDKYTISDLPIISKNDYQMKWCDFCKNYFDTKKTKD